MFRFHLASPHTSKYPSTPSQAWSYHLTYKLFMILVWHYLSKPSCFPEIFKAKIYFCFLFRSALSLQSIVFDEKTMNEWLKVQKSVSSECDWRQVFIKLIFIIWKDPDAGKDWGQEEKGTTEDEMVGWHHRLSGHEFGSTPGVGDGQGGLVCCSSWGCKESDMTERLNWIELNWITKKLLKV